MADERKPPGDAADRAPRTADERPAWADEPPFVPPPLSTLEPAADRNPEDRPSPRRAEREGPAGTPGADEKRTAPSRPAATDEKRTPASRSASADEKHTTPSRPTSPDEKHTAPSRPASTDEKHTAPSRSASADEKHTAPSRPAATDEKRTPASRSASADEKRATGPRLPRSSEHRLDDGSGASPPRSPSSPATSYAADETTDPAFSRGGRRLLGLPIWGWLLIAATLLGALLLLLDLRNRNRYLIVCRSSTAELHKGRTFPWPFGHENLGGTEFKPVAIPAQADCRARDFHSQEEAELAFLELILGQVRNALANAGSADLGRARQQVLQALLLTRTHRGRRREAEQMLAELAYREGRAGLTRVENELRTSLARFQEAEKLDSERWEDLADWIALLEDLLRTVSPPPGAGLPRGAARAPLLGPAPGAGPSPLPAPRTPLPGSPSAPRSPGPDAGPSPTGGGILM